MTKNDESTMTGHYYLVIIVQQASPTHDIIMTHNHTHNVGRGYFVHGAILVFVAKIIICKEIGTS